MPKKRSHIPFSKPASSAHPSLQTQNRRYGSLLSNANRENGEHSGGVNDLIHHLRSTQVSRESQIERTVEGTNPRTVHPSLKQLMNIPDTPPPRPRPGLRIQAAGRRHVRPTPGPPAPMSWTYSPTQRRSVMKKEQEKTASEFRTRSENSIPGMEHLQQESLYHTALRQIAKDWQWHSYYDQYCIPSLPTRMKQQLLSAIACFSNVALDIKDLELLFLDETDLPEATGSDTVTHLDLQGYLASIKSLGTYFKKPCTMQAMATVTPSTLDDTPTGAGSSIPDSWDDAPVATIAGSPHSLRFPHLTHLSLAAIRSPSWSALLNFIPTIATLTHLSLAHWPVPCLTPNSMTAYTASPRGDVPFGGSNLYSFFDGDLAEPAGILRRLSKATYCLRWLDLSGCTDWATSVLQRADGADWYGAWRGLEIIKLHQAWRPKCIDGERWQVPLDWAIGRGTGKWEASNTVQDVQKRKDEASDLLSWLQIELAIYNGLRAATESILKRNRNIDTAADGTAEARSWNQDRPSWWIRPLEAAETESTDQSAMSSHSKRKITIHFDQGWEENPPLKACIDTYFVKLHVRPPQS